ncbi:MAG TPA: hypothetical protein VFK07_03615 [Candidatus Paceibacterota bacterium]|nr:hypothetical protein [Candidatus Paceibacterota bacterium]
MKTHVLRMRAENKDIFDAIRAGKKKVETRAATDKYRKIQEGDKLKFVCGGDSFQRNVVSVQRFKNIKTILKKYKPQEINPKNKTEKEVTETYYSFPEYREKIKKFGLIAFELK